MATTRISEYRSNLSAFHARVLQNHEPLIVSGSSRGDIIVMPAEDYERLKESVNVLKDRATLNSLIQSRTEIAAGQVKGANIEEVFDDVIDSEDK